MLAIKQHGVNTLLAHSIYICPHGGIESLYAQVLFCEILIFTYKETNKSGLSDEWH